METICRYLDVSLLQDETLFQHWFDALPWDSRREKIRSYKFENGKRLSLGAGIVLAETLRDFGVTDTRLRIEESGRPLLESGELFFSLSHSGTMAVCAASQNPIGVDVEEVREIRAEPLMRFLHEEEQEMIQAAEDRNFAFLKIWTRNESFGKRSGEGIGRSLKEESLVSLHPSDSVFFQEFLADGHLITVCSQGEPVKFVRTEP